MLGSGVSLLLDVGQFSHPGRKRSNNEDWLGAFQPEDGRRLAQKGSLFVVADGMGGHRSGETASRLAVDQVIRAYMDQGGDDVAAGIERAVALANAALHSSADESAGSRRRGTTLVAAIVRHQQLWIANVGDSRAYLWHCDKLQQLSQDHSWAAAGAEAGLGDGWGGRHVLTRALGTKPKVEVDLFGPLPLEVGDRVLLCSDGLTGPLSDADIQIIVARPGSAQWICEKLVEAANARGGPDNVSALVVEVKGQKPGSGQIASSLGRTWQRVRVALEARLKAGLSPQLIGVLVLALVLLIGLGFLLGLILFHG